MTPFLGQGAGQAVEDAYVLSKIVGGISPEEIPTGLKRYESIRVPRANDIHRQAEKSGENFYHLPDGHRQEERDRWLKELPRTWPFGTRQEIWSYVPPRELSAEV
jgi:salicylate hydroxylase